MCVVFNHQVKNGLLLCRNCHGNFDKLKRYVDIIDNQLVVKVVCKTNDTTSPKYKEWRVAVEIVENERILMQRAFFPERKAIEENGEMALYFITNDANLFPNRKALEFHKAACLIWRMAGGAYEDDQYCCDDSDDDFVPVDYKTKNIRGWMDSSGGSCLHCSSDP